MLNYDDNAELPYSQSLPLERPGTKGGSGSLSYVYDAASRLASLNDTTTIGTGFLRQFSVSPLAPLAASALSVLWLLSWLCWY